MKIRTFSLTVSAGRDDVFEFFSNPESLPVWAKEYCQGIRSENGEWRITTPGGEMVYSVKSDKDSGVCDMLSRPSKEEMNPMFARVVGDESSCSALFTFCKCPHISDAMYDQHCRSLKHELEEIGARFGGGEVSVTHMPSNAYTGLVVSNARKSASFYEGHLGYISVFSSEGYMHLAHPKTGTSLALLEAGECDQMPEFDAPTTGKGTWIGLEVESADAEGSRLEKEGVELVQPPTDQPWGERTVVVRDPDGVLVYLANPIAVEMAVDA